MVDVAKRSPVPLLGYDRVFVAKDIDESTGWAIRSQAIMKDNLELDTKGKVILLYYRDM